MALNFRFIPEFPMLVGGTVRQKALKRKEDVNKMPPCELCQH